MLAENPLIELQWRVERHYDKYVFQRLFGASIFAGTAAIATSYVVYSITNSFHWCAAAVLLGGWLFQNFFIRLFVPAESFFQESKELVTGAITSPGRIKKADGKTIIIEDVDGEERCLKKMERRIWNSSILPYIIEEKKRIEAQRKSLQSAPAGRVESRRTELNEWEQKMQKERTLLKTEREKLEKRIRQLKNAETKGGPVNTALERAGIGPSAASAQEEKISLEKRSSELEIAARELEERTKYVNYVEDSLVERLNELTRREAELQQKEINHGILEDS